MPIGPLPPITPSIPLTSTAPASAPTSAGSPSGGSFADSVTGALDNLAQSHTEVDALAQQAATGDLTAVHDFTIAASEAQLLTELTVEVRNRAIEAFNDIMRMQV